MAELFNIRAESDLSELTSTVVSDGTITQTAGSAQASTSGGIAIEITTPSTAARYVTKTFTAQTSATDLYIRWYWNRSTLASTNGNAQNWMELYGSSTATRLAHCRLNYSTTPHWQIRCSLVDDALSETNGTYYTIGDTWPAYMQIHIQKATNGTGASDGFMKLYAEDTIVDSVTGIDFYDHFSFDEIWMGHTSLVDAACTGIVFLDEITATNSGGLIGAYAPPPVNTVPVDTLGIFMTSDSATQLSSVSPSTAISVVDAAGLTTCRVYCTSGDLTVTLSGSVVISAGANGSSDLTLGSGASTAEFNTVLATLTYQGDTDFHGTDTINVVSTGTGGSDTDTFNVLNDPRSLTLTATEPNFSSLVTATATTQMRMDAGRQSATCQVTATDDDALTDVQTITLQVAASESVFPYRNLAVPTARRNRR